MRVKEERLNAAASNNVVSSFKPSGLLAFVVDCATVRLRVVQALRRCTICSATQSGTGLAQHVYCCSVRAEGSSCLCWDMPYRSMGPLLVYQAVLSCKVIVETLLMYRLLLSKSLVEHVILIAGRIYFAVSETVSLR